jgi:hypothetical protein
VAEQLSGQDGRQGTRGKPALYVLIASMLMLVVATVGLLVWNHLERPNIYNDKSQDSVRKVVNGQANGTSSTNSASVPAANPAYPAPAVRNANP